MRGFVVGFIFGLWVGACLVGCGAEGGSSPTFAETQIDEDFVAMVDAFAADATKYDRTTLPVHSIRWAGAADGVDVSSLDGDSIILGRCLTWKNGRREVIFNKAGWVEMDEYSRLLLVYHEMAHCALDLPHRSTGIHAHDGGPMWEIMNPMSNMKDGSRIEANWDLLVENLMTFHK